VILTLVRRLRLTGLTVAGTPLMVRLTAVLETCPVRLDDFVVAVTCCMAAAAGWPTVVWGWVGRYLDRYGEA